MNATEVESWMSRHHFFLRRLHSLMGIIPIGAFLVEHMLTNSLAWFGPEKFNEQVHWLHNMHYLLWLEILFVFLPLAFHAVYGVAIALTGRANVGEYGYADNWRYTLQRVTAWITVIFIVVHLLHFRFAHWLGGPVYPHTPDPFALTQEGFARLMPAWLWIAIYAVGMTAAIYHFCNGIVTFCITWGITVSDASRRRMSGLAAVAGVVMLLWGSMSLVGLSRDAEAAHRPLAPPPAQVQAEAGLPG